MTGGERGYSLFEMLLVLALAAGAVGVSAPFLVQYAENSKFESAARRVVFQMRRTKMLAIAKGKSHAVCVPMGEPNWNNRWRFLTVADGGDCGGAGENLIDTVIDYRVFQKSGKTEVREIWFHRRGTSTNKSFCLRNRRGTRWKKITVSNFARITAEKAFENPCD